MNRINRKTNQRGLFFFLIAAFVLTLPRPAASMEGVPRILLVETMPVPVVLEHSRWFTEELESLGYQNGRNLSLRVIEANGSRDTAERLLREEIDRKSPDVVVSNATLASQAAYQVLTDTGIPMLFMTVSDPVGAGLVEAIGVPTGTNVTGRVHMIDRETRVRIVMQIIETGRTRKPLRFGFIHSSYPSAVGDLRELERVAQRRSDFAMVPYRVEYRTVPEGIEGMLKDVSAGIERLEEQIDFWWEPSGPLGELDEYSRLLLERSKKPIVMGTKKSAVRMGALVHLTPSVEGSGREIARLTDAILKGADPGSIPPVPPSSFDLAVNLQTALSLGLVVPPEILRLAGENIFR